MLAANARPIGPPIREAQRMRGWILALAMATMGCAHVPQTEMVEVKDAPPPPPPKVQPPSPRPDCDAHPEDGRCIAFGFAELLTDFPWGRVF
jgi:hypothetical protein